MAKRKSTALMLRSKGQQVAKWKREATGFSMTDVASGAGGALAGGAVRGVMGGDSDAMAGLLVLGGAFATDSNNLAIAAVGMMGRKLNEVGADAVRKGMSKMKGGE